MTSDQKAPESTPLPAPVTGVARGGHGTGTALDDTQLYDVSDFTPIPPTPPAPAAQPAPVQSHRAAAAPVAVPPAAAAPIVAAPVASPGPATRAPSRATTSSRRRRVGTPVVGLAGFALAAGLAILIGLALGGVPMPDGAAAGGETTAPTLAAPAETEPPDPDPDDYDGGGSGNGNGNGNGNNGNGNGRGNGNNDD